MFSSTWSTDKVQSLYMGFLQSSLREFQILSLLVLSYIRCRRDRLKEYGLHGNKTALDSESWHPVSVVTLLNTLSVYIYFRCILNHINAANLVPFHCCTPFTYYVSSSRCYHNTIYQTDKKFNNKLQNRESVAMA
jgi:hypothetical protein